MSQHFPKYQPEVLLLDFPLVEAKTKQINKESNKTSTICFQITVKDLTGTLNGTVTPVCSLDGENWANMENETPINLGNANGTYVFSKHHNPYFFIGLKIETVGITGGTMTILYNSKNITNQ